MKLIRVFPRRTKQTPNDENAYVGEPTLFAEADKVMVSCTFTWDKTEAERLAEAWKWVAPTELGGPAYGDPGDEFEPGMFLRPGYTITSRGCPNRCWFCYVWKRSGGLRELEIKDGWIVQDDNLLACSENHIRKVFKMLKRQRHRAVFSGGLEARILKDWHIDLLLDLKPQQMFFAYDTADDYEPLAIALNKLTSVGFTRNRLYVYVLSGYPKQSMEQAEKRMREVLALGATPFSMLYRDDKGETDKEWRKFQRSWCRPAVIFAQGRK